MKNISKTIIPGQKLLEALEKKKMNQKELAQRIGLTEKYVSHIINGTASITPDTAIKLEVIFNDEEYSAKEWNRLEREFRSELANKNYVEQLQKEEDIFLNKYKDCYEELVKIKAIQKTNNPQDKVLNLLNFFGVSSLTYVSKVKEAVFRSVKNPKIDKGALEGWLRVGEKEALKMNLPAYNKQKIKNNISKIKCMTRSPEDFEDKLKTICKECGIALVFTPYFKKTYINGATRWLGDNPLIQLNLRLNYSDTFWFTFFHELGHVLLHSKKIGKNDFNLKNEEDNNDFLEYTLPAETDTESRQQEADANFFASKTLIPPKEETRFKESGDFSDDALSSFAYYLGIDIGIVAGRLAYDGYLKYSDIAHLRTKLKFSDS